MLETRETLHPAYLLHQRPYRNTSALVDLFTPDFGRFTLVAKGIRVKKSKLVGLVQPFRPLYISWVSKGDLGTLHQVEARGLPLSLTGGQLLCGFYLNELLMRLLQRHDASPELFSHYEAAIQCLHELPQNHELPQLPLARERLLRIFEKNLLLELGYGLLLGYDAESGEAIQPGVKYHYYLEKGPVRAMSGESRGLQLSGQSLLDLAEESLTDPGSLRECKRLMRDVLALYLGAKPLHSRELFIQMKQ